MALLEAGSLAGRCVLSPKQLPHNCPMQIATWARDHCEAVAAAASRQMAHLVRVAAAAEVGQQEAARPATASAPDRSNAQLGPGASAGREAAVQQAARSVRGPAGQGGSLSTTTQQQLELRGVALPWPAAAAASSERCAREQQRSAAQQRLRKQWEAVRDRLPGAAVTPMAAQGRAPLGLRPGSTKPR